MEVRIQQDAKSVCMKRGDGAMSAGEVLEEELCLKAVALLCVVSGEEENEQEERDLLVAAALSKVDDAEVALLVREGWRGASLFSLGNAGYVYLLSLLRACFHVFEIGRVPSINNMRGVYHDCWQRRVHFLLRDECFVVFFPFGLCA